MEVKIKSGYSSLRKGRSSIPNQIYLVTTVTLDREPIFKDWRLGRILVQVLRYYQHAAGTLCYVVMPDHLHWLAQLKGPFSLAQVVGGVKGRSSSEIGRVLGRTGPVWQDGYHDRALRSEEQLLPIARYIVANPLRAGLVEKIGDYPLWDAIWLE